MMTRSTLSKLIGLSAAVLVGQLGVLTSTVDAQCRGSALSTPMWEIYGVNPYQPRVKSPQHFTALQSQVATSCPLCWQTNPVIGHAGAASPHEIFLCDVSSADATVTSNSFVFEPAASNPVVVESDQPRVVEGDVIKGDVIKGDVVKGDSTSANATSISSPSDIVIAPPKSVEPTPAAIPSSEMKAELENARNEIEKLNAELKVMRDKARTSSERAYAAEKAATAADSKKKKPK